MHTDESFVHPLTRYVILTINDTKYTKDKADGINKIMPSLKYLF